jgi:SRSO17 transposase
VAARGCNAAGSWRCGCARPGSRHAGWARADGGELPTRWLLVEWPLGKATPTKYWLANLPETTPLVELVGLARSRWRVEQDYRELKGALGLDHFGGRGWPGWHHHVTLVTVAHGFLTLERLRRPKPAASA